MKAGSASARLAPMSLRVSVLTPSYNQAHFLSENIASIRAQGDVILEHIVMDGASTDGTRALLEKSNGVTWVSEPDKGQSDALNKALAIASGEVIGWLNSDDAYCEGAAARAVALLEANPELAMVYGHCEKIDAEGKHLGSVDAYDVDLEQLLSFDTIPQPSCFIRRSALDAAGGLDASYRYTMDYDLWLRIALSGGKWLAVDETWAKFRLHGASKTVSESARFLPELERARDKALASPRLPAHLAARRTSILRRFHTRYAQASYANLDLDVARAQIWRAARVDPLGLERDALSCALKSMLPLPLVVAARRVKAAARSLV